MNGGKKNDVSMLIEQHSKRRLGCEYDGEAQNTVEGLDSGTEGR